MKPGRELDALIAEKVMGWKRDGRKLINPDDPSRSPTIEGDHDWHEWSSWLPKYSTDIAVAWKVFDKFRNNSLTRGAAGSYICRFGLIKDEMIIEVNARERTAPHAICLAALLAVEKMEGV